MSMRGHRFLHRRSRGARIGSRVMFLRAQSSPAPALFLVSILAPMLAGCLSRESTDACQRARGGCVRAGRRR